MTPGRASCRQCPFRARRKCGNELSDRKRELFLGLYDVRPRDKWRQLCGQIGGRSGARGRGRSYDR